MSLDFNLGGVSSAGKPLPEGDYSFLIEAASVSEAKNKQSHNLKLKMTVTSLEENGRVHTENLNLQEKTLPFVKAFLTALWNVEDDDVENVSFDIDESDGTVRSVNDREIVGAEIGGVIKHVDAGDDSGKVYGNVVGWFSV